jgi:ectoine hydroxylase-related dioxygenase (phytanoyl-CoA dioxygenase family)
MWHKASIKFNELCRNSTILDYVEDLLGPNFYQWGGQFFTKYPNDGSVVPWHQDAQYWPLSPQRTVTVWLAVFDSDAGNGAMQIVNGSHKKVLYRIIQTTPPIRNVTSSKIPTFFRFLIDKYESYFLRICSIIPEKSFPSPPALE